MRIGDLLRRELSRCENCGRVGASLQPSTRFKDMRYVTLGKFCDRECQRRFIMNVTTAHLSLVPE